ncbi:MAG: hypothetical protein IKJ05_06635 [Oscillospiraceae bacterium]|nr:hypothetical protein [Oscillospiraceae bacterium]
MIDLLYKKFNRTKLVLSAILLAMYIAGTVLAGGKLWQLPIFILGCCVYIFLPGRAVYHLLGMDDCFPVNGRFHSLYYVFGFAFLIITYIGGFMAGPTALKTAPVLLIAVSLFTVKTKEINGPKKTTADNSQLVLMFLIFSFVVFIYAFLGVAKHAHPVQAGQIFLSQDFMWTVGNAESFKNSLPPMDIRFDGVVLKYHYLVELVTAALSSFTGISCYDLLGFFMQPLMTLFFLTALYDLGNLYYNLNEGKTNLFVMSFYALSCLSLWKVLPNGNSVFTYSLLETVISNVNSQCTALGFLAVFCGLAVNMLRGHTKADVKYISITLLTFVMLIFSKSPIAAIVALAMICAAVVNLLTKNEKKIAGIFSLVTLAVFAAIYFGFLSAGTGKSTMFSLTKTLELGYFKNYLNLFMHTNPALYKIAIPGFMLLQTICMAPFQSVTVFPRMLRDLFRIFKLTFEKLWFYAAVAGGTLAFFITYHEAFSQVYFIYVAIFFMNLLAVEYFDFTKFRFKYIIHYGLIVLSCITTLFFYTNFGGSGIRQYLFHYDILEKYPYKWCVKAEDELAGQWLKENMADGELFVTNRTHTGQGEGLSNVYTCYSGRQSYMEGFKYTVSNMGTDWETQVKPRVENVGRIFGTYSQPVATADEIADICTDNNIRYAVFSTQFEGDTSGIENFSLVFEDRTVKIYKIY